MYKPLDQSIPNIKSTSVQFENAQIDLAQTDRKGRPLQYYFWRESKGGVQRTGSSCISEGATLLLKVEGVD